jgi:hypothetical protein
MAKYGTKSGKTSGAKRAGSIGAFTIGRESFASISAVEGIKVSRKMDEEFRRTDNMSADKRRSTLSSQFGNKK